MLDEEELLGYKQANLSTLRGNTISVPAFSLKSQVYRVLFQKLK